MNDIIMKEISRKAYYYFNWGYYYSAGYYVCKKLYEIFENDESGIKAMIPIYTGL
jgi:hypothetical protein